MQLINSIAEDHKDIFMLNFLFSIILTPDAKIIKICANNMYLQMVSVGKTCISAQTSGW